jgi:hypothetical protein
MRWFPFGQECAAVGRRDTALSSYLAFTLLWVLFDRMAPFGQSYHNVSWNR